MTPRIYFCCYQLQAAAFPTIKKKKKVKWELFFLSPADFGFSLWGTLMVFPGVRVPHILQQQGLFMSLTFLWFHFGDFSLSDHMTLNTLPMRSPQSGWWFRRRADTSPFPAASSSPSSPCQSSAFCLHLWAEKCHMRVIWVIDNKLLELWPRSHLEDFELAGGRVQVLCVLFILILFKSVYLDSERDTLFPSVLAHGKFCANAVYLRRKSI